MFIPVRASTADVSPAPLVAASGAAGTYWSRFRTYLWRSLSIRLNAQVYKKLTSQDGNGNDNIYPDSEVVGCARLLVADAIGVTVESETFLVSRA